MADTDDAAVAYLGQLREGTMRRAWGEGIPVEDRRRIVSAALIFGHQFDESLQDRPAVPDEGEARRLLMDLMNRVVRRFAAQEGMGLGEAAEFLGEVGRRDRVLEFSEVLDAHRESGRPLDGLLQEAVDDRRNKALRAGLWPG
jgi:hypothetical protein